MHVVDKLLKLHLKDRSEPKSGVVPKTLTDLIKRYPDKKSEQYNWLSQFITKSSMWPDAISYTSPDIAADNIKDVTKYYRYITGYRLWTLLQKSVPTRHNLLYLYYKYTITSYRWLLSGIILENYVPVT